MINRAANRQANRIFLRACIGTGIALPLLVALPHALSVYWQSVLVLFTINAVSLMGYRLITTMGGWSFAHISTAGLGAYTTAVLTTLETPWSFWATFFLGALIAGAFAMIIAYPVLRTRHYYFFLSTFAAGEALRQCYVQFSGITGGTYGISFIPRPEPILGMDFGNSVGFYYLALSLAVVVGLLLYRFDLSRLGHTIKAVAANEELSESIGVNTWALRTLPFVMGSVVAGFSGVLYANFNGLINPLDFSAVSHVQARWPQPSSAASRPSGVRCRPALPDRVGRGVPGLHAVDSAALGRQRPRRHPAGGGRPGNGHHPTRAARAALVAEPRRPTAGRGPARAVSDGDPRSR